MPGLAAQALPAAQTVFPGRRRAGWALLRRPGRCWKKLQTTKELERAQEIHNVLLLLWLQAVESVDYLGGLRANLPWGAIAGMQFNCSHNVTGAAVMQEENPLAHAPKRRGAEFVASGLALADAVGQSRTHVMQREVRERVEIHSAQRTQVGFGRAQRIGMAQHAADTRVGSGARCGRNHRAEQGLAAQG